MAMQIHHLASHWGREAWHTLEAVMAGANIRDFWSLLQGVFGDCTCAREETESQANDEE